MTRTIACYCAREATYVAYGQHRVEKRYRNESRRYEYRLEVTP